MFYALRNSKYNADGKIDEGEEKKAEDIVDEMLGSYRNQSPGGASSQEYVSSPPPVPPTVANNQTTTGGSKKISRKNRYTKRVNKNRKGRHSRKRTKRTTRKR
jgi:hypothetical protein